jgi:hypothetical protein
MNSDNNLSESQIKKKDINKKWYAENKEQKLAYLKEKIICEVCNMQISRGSMNDHKKTILHLQNTEKYTKKNLIASKINELDIKLKEIKDLLD